MKPFLFPTNCTHSYVPGSRYNLYSILSLLNTIQQLFILICTRIIAARALLLYRAQIHSLCIILESFKCKPGTITRKATANNFNGNIVYSFIASFPLTILIFIDFEKLFKTNLFKLQHAFHCSRGTSLYVATRDSHAASCFDLFFQCPTSSFFVLAYFLSYISFPVFVTRNIMVRRKDSEVGNGNVLDIYGKPTGLSMRLVYRIATSGKILWAHHGGTSIDVGEVKDVQGQPRGSGISNEWHKNSNECEWSIHGVPGSIPKKYYRPKAGKTITLF